MLRASVGLFLFLAASSRVDAQRDSAPRVLHKVDPEYSFNARAAHIEGSVVLQIMVDENGRATDVHVATPLGFGLEDRAVAAMEKWQFAPAIKDGHPVKVRATVAVNFRFPDLWFDGKTEPGQVPFDEALSALGQLASAVKVMRDLARQQFPPALYTVGLLEITGEVVAKDPVDGLELLQEAAASNYGRALYQLAIRQLEDSGQGLETMRRASLNGSTQAQFYLANRCATGSGVPRDPEQARAYYS